MISLVCQSRSAETQLSRYGHFENRVALPLLGTSRRSRVNDNSLQRQRRRDSVFTEEPLSIRIMSQVWDDQTITSRADLLVLLALADFANDSNNMKFTKSIETSDLKLFGSLEEAQRHEIKLVFGNPTDETAAFGIKEIADTLFEQRDKVLDILTTTERSRPSARKINGGRKKRAAQAVATEAKA